MEPYHYLLTAEGEALQKSGETPWNIYPRPTLRRESFFSLNGSWSVSINGGADEVIRVPFVPESLLSGIGRRLGRSPKLVYKKDFSLPDGFQKSRVLLHFGAVMKESRVTLNGQILGEHIDGYDPFMFDITDVLAHENHLTVEASSDTRDSTLPYGKQRHRRGGMWYTPVTGIWQTVWLESVPEHYVRALGIETNENRVCITADGVTEGSIALETPDGMLTIPLHNGKAELTVKNPRLWSPEDPYLYRFTLTAGEDSVSSYFALRTLTIETVCGIRRLCLNKKPYFFNGLLDQGYFSDGIFTPASPENFTRDICDMKQLGFNMLRKHIKIEPEIFYYECDRLGMIVFQDMVNNGGYSFLRDTALPTVGLQRLPDKWMHPNKRTRAAFALGMEQTVNRMKKHPSVCCYTIFNEGWGQFDGTAMYKKLQRLDNTRFIDTASGWFSGALSDVESLHVYFKPVRIAKSDKPVVLSEFGGYSYKPAGHVFNTEKTYGYRLFTDQAAFEDALVKLYEQEILPAVKNGLCAAVYTQVSDVEDETNGLLSYDRRVCKVAGERLRAVNEAIAGEIQQT